MTGRMQARRVDRALPGNEMAVSRRRQRVRITAGFAVAARDRPAKRVRDQSLLSFTGRWKGIGHEPKERRILSNLGVISFAEC